MTIKFHNPPGIAAPASFYSHGAEVSPNARWLHISGQVGVDPQGAIAEGLEAQAHCVWKNTLAVLESADMGINDIVKVNTFLMTRDAVPVMRVVRDSYLQGHQAASSLFVVAALAHPDWLIEMETFAAK